MFFELLAELRDVGLHRPRRRVGEYADRLAFHVAGNRQQIIQVLKPSFALGNTIEDAVHPARSFPARRTLAARLVREELRRALQRLEHARGVVHHDDAARSGHRAGRHQRVEVHVDVDLRCGEHLRRDPARNDGLERPAFTDSLCVAFDQLTQGHTDWRFVESRPLDVPANREQPRTALPGRAEAREALRPFAQNERHARQRLDVVDDRRAVEQTGDGRKRRLELRKALAAFQ